MQVGFGSDAKLSSLRADKLRPVPSAFLLLLHPNIGHFAACCPPAMAWGFSNGPGQSLSVSGRTKGQELENKSHIIHCFSYRVQSELCYEEACKMVKRKKAKVRKQGSRGSSF